MNKIARHLLLLTLPALARAQTVSPIQSAADPFGLAIVDKVRLAGSDAAGTSFQAGVLPSITDLVNLNLKETVSLKNVSSELLDPSLLNLATNSTVRVYFIGEGAGYHNTLAFSYVTANAPATATPIAANINSQTQLIFPDASSSVSTYDPASTAVRTSANPLLPGDFVDLGKFTSAGRLDLTLISNGANGGKDAFVASAAQNVDKINHVVAFAMKNSPFLIVAFEDLKGGGDKDYNDVVVAVDVGRANVSHMVSGPTPPLALTLPSLLGLAAWFRRRQAALAA